MLMVLLEEVAPRGSAVGAGMSIVPPPRVKFAVPSNPSLGKSLKVVAVG